MEIGRSIWIQCNIWEFLGTSLETCSISHICEQPVDQDTTPLFKGLVIDNPGLVGWRVVRATAQLRGSGQHATPKSFPWSILRCLDMKLQYRYPWMKDGWYSNGTGRFLMVFGRVRVSCVSDGYQLNDWYVSHCFCLHCDKKLKFGVQKQLCSMRILQLANNATGQPSRICYAQWIWIESHSPQGSA